MITVSFDKAVVVDSVIVTVVVSSGISEDGIIGSTDGSVDISGVRRCRENQTAVRSRDFGVIHICHGFS